MDMISFTVNNYYEIGQSNQAIIFPNTILVILPRFFDDAKNFINILGISLPLFYCSVSSSNFYIKNVIILEACLNDFLIVLILSLLVE